MWSVLWDIAKMIHNSGNAHTYVGNFVSQYY